MGSLARDLLANVGAAEALPFQCSPGALYPIEPLITFFQQQTADRQPQGQTSRWQPSPRTGVGCVPSRRSCSREHAVSRNASGRCQVVRVIRRQALNRLVTPTDGHFGRARPHAATANAVVSETTSHSRQRRRITVR
jgi:hypothetical protein